MKNNIRNLIVSEGYYSGTPATIVELYDRPGKAWIEDIPTQAHHAHLLLTGNDPLKWPDAIDEILHVVNTQMAFCYVQIITSMDDVERVDYPVEWLSVRVLPVDLENETEALHKHANELIVHVDPTVNLDRVVPLVEPIRNFELVVSFMPTQPNLKAQALKMVCDFDRHYSNIGVARYVEPIDEGGV